MTPIEFTILILLLSCGVFIVFICYLMFFKDRDKHFFLFFDSDKSCSLITRKVEYGSVQFQNNLFYVDETRPFFLKRSFGFQNPLIFLKWSDVIPIDVIRNKIKDGIVQSFDNMTGDTIKINEEKINKLAKYNELILKNPSSLTNDEKLTFQNLMKDEDIKEYSLRSKLTPKGFKKFYDSELASKLLKPTGKLDMILFIIVGGLIGGMASALLFALHVIKI